MKLNRENQITKEMLKPVCRLAGRVQHDIICRFWPLFFILLVWFIFSSPYFLKGKVPYSSTYQVNSFHPWSMYSEFAGPVKNNAMPDVTTQIYPWKKLTIDAYKMGQIPLWDPYNFTGNPHLANIQSAVLSPFNLLFFVLPFIDAWSLLILFQPLMAGLFIYLLAKVLGISKWGSLMASVFFMFCGFITTWMAYGTLVYAILYLPLALWSIEKFYLTKKKKFLIVLTLTVPLSFFSGHIQTSFYFFISVLFYIGFKLILNRNLLSAFYSKKSFAYFLLSTFLGLILSLPQLWPAFQLYLQTPRSESFGHATGISLKYLVTVLAPDFFGNAVTRNDWFGYYAEWASFIGVWALVLVLLALVKINKKQLPFAIIGFGSLVLATFQPLISFLGTLRIPILSNSAANRIIVLFSFSFAVLAGFGFDYLREILESKKGLKKLFITLGIMTIFFLLVWLILIFMKPFPLNGLLIAKRNFILPTLFFCGGILLIFLNIKFKRFFPITAFYLLLATSFDSLRFAQKWMPFDPRNLVYPETPIIKAIQANIGDGRIYGNLGGEVSSYYKIPVLSGYDSLYISRYGEFTGAGGINTAGVAPRLPIITDRILDLTGVVLIYHPIADTNQSWAYPVWEKKDRYEIVYQDDKFLLFKNKKTLPRAALFYNYQVIIENKKILETFYDPQFDFRKVLILEKNPGLALKEGHGQAEITFYSPDLIEIKAKSSDPALLFLADNFYPSWEAEVNGRKTEIFRADYTFRTVLIPQGESMIKFKMRWF